MKYIKLFEELINEKWDYFNNSFITDLAKNARKWKEEDFIEEYVDLHDIRIYDTDSKFTYANSIKKGNSIDFFKIKRDDKGKIISKNDRDDLMYYKTVIAEKDYNDKGWQFILDNSKELAKEARKLYHKNKYNKKPEFDINKNTIIAYHSSKNKFDMFKYGMEKSSWIGSGVGFFFFLKKKNADYFASVIKDNHGKSYLYEVIVDLGNNIEYRGEEIGIGWGRHGDLSQAEIEGYDTVIVRDADTGYGITDELVVFDDDNIKIKNIEEL